MSTRTELPKTYDFQQTEARWYKYWESNGYFSAKASSTAPPFVIVMPPRT